MKKLQTFLLKLFIVALAVFIADAAIGRLMEHAYFRIRHGEQGRVNYVVDSTVAPTLVLGSSRASHHYVSAILQDSLQQPCYNAGKDRQGLFYDLAVLKMVLCRYHPRRLILDLNPTQFRDAGWDNLSVLLPFYRRHPEIRPIIDRRSSWEKWKTKSRLYCYNSLPAQISFNNLSGERDAGAVEGYVPLYEIKRPSFFFPYADQLLTGTPDTTIVDALMEIIAISRQAGAELTIVISPFYFPLPQGSSTLRLVRQICDQQQVFLFDYSQSPAFTGNPALFGDAEHMNDSGARVFTRTLSHDLIEKSFGRKTPG
ncbi:MAG TPA: SGNH/GDSL hydrolase family protein [Puia sp.]|nr:SGNH/GDSL hydrolase family protein [Puia sp.]